MAETRLNAAQARLAQRDETLRTGGGAAAGNAFALRAPIAGRVTEVMATLGAAYDEGAPLFKIVRTDALELNVFVPAPDVPAVRGLTAVALEFPGRAEPIPLRRSITCTILACSIRRPRRCRCRWKCRIPSGQLLVGQTGTAILLHAADRRACPQCRRRRC